jgi:hypothetical protein
MHADLQRRLIRLVKQDFRQSIVATHSVEIMSEVAPENVLVVERTRNESRYADSAPHVQQVIDQLGGVHNLQLARLWSSKKCILVEGDDISLLRIWKDLLYPNSHEPLDTVPNFDVGGWGGWQRVIGAASAVRTSIGAGISVYCIFDSDYFPESVIKDRHNDARSRNVQLHIWTKKEVENYAVVPAAISRLVRKKQKQGLGPTPNDVADEIDRICEAARVATTAALTDAYFSINKGAGSGTAATMAIKRLNSAWKIRETKWALVSGKEVISSLSRWSQQQWNVSFNAETIARAMVIGEVDQEVKCVLGCIEECAPF